MADPNAHVPPQQVFAAATALPLNGAPAPAPPPAPVPEAVPVTAKTAPPHEHKDGTREIVETIVFVVVLVLLLKSFVAEAFVIPTGSMAETLWGYQKVIDCPKCQHRFPLNCSAEVDPQDGMMAKEMNEATCPNCRHRIVFKDEGMNPTWGSGDRVLVAKYFYDLLGRMPERHDVVVFKYPTEPQKRATPTNYIKRLVGLPGETIAIWYGDLYHCNSLTYEGRPRPERKEDLWRFEYMYQNDEEALNAFKNGRFDIVRKAPGVLLAERRIVYDNEHQNPDRPQRWAPEKAGNGWTADGTEKKRFVHSAEATPLSWLRYQHILEPGRKPELITDFLGYNSFHVAPPQNWVGDLMLECEVTIQQAQGQLVLELSRGADRFQARFDLAAKSCVLVRLSEAGEVELGRKEVELKASGKPDRNQVELKAGGTYNLRFANFDHRLTLWVNSALPFDDGVSYRSPAQRRPTGNDLQPASIGAQGNGVRVARLKLWRDTYYTTDSTRQDAPGGVEWGDSNTWGILADLPVKTLYVQAEPRHYLCMGDNSPESSDGRSWGLVPERLLLGRALAIYYPFYFPYWPLYSRANRIGAIK